MIRCCLVLTNANQSYQMLCIIFYFVLFYWKELRKLIYCELIEIAISVKFEWMNVTSSLLLTTSLLLALNPHYIRRLNNIVTVQSTDSQLALDAGSWRTISNRILPEIKRCLTLLELQLQRQPHRALKSIRGREATLVKSNFPLISSALIQGWEALIINREEQRQINSS